jgi:Zn-dependent peptidase ImmA (M78 family)
MNHSPSSDPIVAASRILDAHWDLTLPVRVDLLARHAGVALVPRHDIGHNCRFLSVADARHASGAPVIEFGTVHSVARQRFAIAHALGHFVLGHGTSDPAFQETFSVTDDSPEGACNEFANRLVMPEKALGMLLRQPGVSVESLAQAFGVSMESMSARLVQRRMGRGSVSPQKAFHR